mmetsp:Transcript_19710/g.41545  ORF Transcript_19710/g.41545 Transcript_19710/m.41545 type:complete len:272 (+) Transcript_19710:1217-2032(+)
MTMVPSSSNCPRKVKSPPRTLATMDLRGVVSTSISEMRCCKGTVFVGLDELSLSFTLSLVLPFALSSLFLLALLSLSFFLLSLFGLSLFGLLSSCASTLSALVPPSSLASLPLPPPLGVKFDRASSSARINSPFSTNVAPSTPYEANSNLSSLIDMLDASRVGSTSIVAEAEALPSLSDDDDGRVARRRTHLTMGPLEDMILPMSTPLRGSLFELEEEDAAAVAEAATAAADDDGVIAAADEDAGVIADATDAAAEDGSVCSLMMISFVLC